MLSTRNVCHPLCDFPLVAVPNLPFSIFLSLKYPDNSVGVSDITDHVNKNIRGRVNNVNVPTKWMQEIAQFEVNINSSDYTDIMYVRMQIEKKAALIMPFIE